MAARSLTATPNGINTAIKALTGKGWSKEDLAGEVNIQGKTTTKEIGIATVKKFFAGKSVDRKYFVGICNALDLDWEEICGLKTATPVTESAEPQTDIDALVQTIRQKVYADIHHRCGTMRVLDMEQPIGIGDIYTNVNILEKLSGSRRLGLNELLQDCDLENFDRFLLGQVRYKRVPGLEAVERHRQLMVLGKPGAGKTTFMKRLATLCNHGEFQAQRVPVFVTLKEFAEAKGQPGLEAYIRQQWQACGIEDTADLTQVLKQGRALILLDGLDEVQETDHDRILQEIKAFTGRYRDCQFVMTCRIAAREYTFQHFTEVEVADFDEDQIADFATKWFTTKEDSEKGETFIQRLEDNEPIQELATNPLLLTLLCLVFGEANDFPVNRAELYKEGLDVLLKKWDAKRNIERDQVYKKLSLKRKEDLLSQLAFYTFKKGDYFFKQSVVEQHILDYIRNLPGAQEDEEALQLDSEAVLKSIEAQHGLLVERARVIYSFSHLTFQEYFTARYLISRCNPHDMRDEMLNWLSRQLHKERWREVFILTANVLASADNLLLLGKKSINELAIKDDKIRRILMWVSNESSKNPFEGKDSEFKVLCLSLVVEACDLLRKDKQFCEHHRLFADTNFDNTTAFESFSRNFVDCCVSYIFNSKISSELLERFDFLVEVTETLAVEISRSVLFDFTIKKCFDSIRDGYFKGDLFEYFYHDLSRRFWENLSELENLTYRRRKNLVDVLESVSALKSLIKIFLDRLKENCTAFDFDAESCLNSFWTFLASKEDLWNDIQELYNFSEADDFQCDVVELLMEQFQLWVREDYQVEGNEYFEDEILDLLFDNGVVIFQEVFDEFESKMLDEFERWWDSQQFAWQEQLKQSLPGNISLKYDFNPVPSQLEIFRQYSNATRTLLDCLNSDCYVTKATRQYIEDTLLLPMSEIEKIPVPSR